MIVDFSLLVGGWSPSPEVRTPFQMREEEAKRPLAVVCTLSSNICKMAAVALGWTKSFEEGRWINLDGRNDFDWRPTEMDG